MQATKKFLMWNIEKALSEYFENIKCSFWKIITCTALDDIIFEILATSYRLAFVMSPEDKGVSFPVDCNAKWVEKDNYLSILTFVYMSKEHLSSMTLHCLHKHHKRMYHEWEFENQIFSFIDVEA